MLAVEVWLERLLLAPSMLVRLLSPFHHRPIVDPCSFIPAGQSMNILHSDESWNCFYPLPFTPTPAAPPPLRHLYSPLTATVLPGAKQRSSSCSGLKPACAEGQH